MLVPSKHFRHVCPLRDFSNTWMSAEAVLRPPSGIPTMRPPQQQLQQHLGLQVTPGDSATRVLVSRWTPNSSHLDSMKTCKSWDVSCSYVPCSELVQKSSRCQSSIVMACSQPLNLSRRFWLEGTNLHNIDTYKKNVWIPIWFHM